MPRAAVVPNGLASCCTVLSVFGVIILLALGSAFDNDAHVLMGSVNSPKDGHAVAQLCYAAAIAYAVCFGVCGCQALTHARYAKQGQVRL